MIKVGRMNENLSKGTDLKFWKEQDPLRDDYDDSTVRDMINGLKLAAKILKCSENDVIFFEESDDDPIVDKLHSESKAAKEIKDPNAEKLGNQYYDGMSALWDWNGTRFITISSYGYAQVIIKKSDYKTLINMK